MKRNSIRMAALGVTSALLIGAMSISPAWSYFTDTHTTAGGIRISVEPSSDIEEDFDENGKHVYIKNTSESVPLYVRARAYATGTQISYIGNGEAGGAWVDGGDGWWYWDAQLAPQASTDELNVKIEFKTQEKVIIVNPDGTREEITTETHDGENFNVVVVYEAVPVESGVEHAQDADWAQK